MVIRRLQIVLTLLLFASGSTAIGRRKITAIKADMICEPRRVLTYGDYRVTRRFDGGKSISTVRITKSGRLLASLKERDCLSPNVSQLIGLWPVLGNGFKQLIVVHSSGGMCCYVYHIYELYPAFRLIFSSSKLPVGENELEFEDLDRDGSLEFVQDDLTFADDFEGLAHVSSPRIPIVFKFDPHLGTYCPANDRFRRVSLKWTGETLRDIQRWNKSSTGDWADAGYMPEGLYTLLTYVFAGKEKGGWRFYHREYRLGSRKEERMIRRMLARDPIYRFLSSHRIRRERFDRPHGYFLTR